LREIYTDNEITQYEATMVQNRGTPGAIISPMTADQTLSEKEAAWVSENYFEKTTGANRGKPIVSLAAINVATPSFSPADMNLRQMRWTPEERISALIGIPAIVIGLGAGLEHGTFANYQQAREAAYESYLVPTQALIDEELTTQLMPDFDTDPALRVAHDYDAVRVLQPDMDAMYARIDKVWISGMIDRATAKRELKLEVGPDDEGVYMLSRGASFVSGELTDIGPAADPLIVAGEKLPEAGGETAPAPPVAPKPTNGHSATPIPAAKASVFFPLATIRCRDLNIASCGNTPMRTMRVVARLGAESMIRLRRPNREGVRAVFTNERDEGRLAWHWRLLSLLHEASESQVPASFYYSRFRIATP
jgi:hypothetical protein